MIKIPDERHVSGSDEPEIIADAVVGPHTLTTDDGRVCDVVEWSAAVPVEGAVRVTAELTIRFAAK